MSHSTPLTNIYVLSIYLRCSWRTSPAQTSLEHSVRWLRQTELPYVYL